MWSGTWPGSFDHHLNIMGPRFQRQFTQHFQLAELGVVVGVVQTPGPQTVAQREGDIVLLKNFAQFAEMGVKKIFLVRVRSSIGPKEIHPGTQCP
jgi:hypothetical protein